MFSVVQNRPILACFVAVACLVTVCNAAGSVAELDENTWDKMLTGEWMVEL